MSINPTSRGLFVIGIVVVLVFAGVAIPSAVTAQDTTTNETTTDNGTMAANGTVVDNISLAANPTTAGAVSNHTVNITIGDAVAGNLTEINIDYSDTNVSTGPVTGNFSSVTLANQSIPIPSSVTFATSGITGVGSDPTEIAVSFDMNQSLQPEAGNQLTLFYPVHHPSEAGNYTVSVLLNPDSDAVSLTTNLTVTPNETTPAAEDNETTMAGVGNETETTAEDNGIGVGNETETTAEDDGIGGIGGGTETTAEDGGAGAGGETTTTGSGPGFTAFAGLIAILAVTLLAIRRN